jgi:hypothetical protein
MTENLRIPLSVTNLIGILFLVVGFLRCGTDLHWSVAQVGRIFCNKRTRDRDHSVCLTRRDVLNPTKRSSCCVSQMGLTLCNAVVHTSRGGERGRLEKYVRLNKHPQYPYTIDSATSRSSFATGVNKCFKLNYFAATEIDHTSTLLKLSFFFLK